MLQKRGEENYGEIPDNNNNNNNNNNKKKNSEFWKNQLNRICGRVCYFNTSCRVCIIVNIMMVQIFSEI